MLCLNEKCGNDVPFTGFCVTCLEDSETALPDVQDALGESSVLAPERREAAAAHAVGVVANAKFLGEP